MPATNAPTATVASIPGVTPKRFRPSISPLTLRSAQLRCNECRTGCCCRAAESLAGRSLRAHRQSAADARAQYSQCESARRAACSAGGFIRVDQRFDCNAPADCGRREHRSSPRAEDLQHRTAIQQRPGRRDIRRRGRCRRRSLTSGLPIRRPPSRMMPVNVSSSPPRRIRLCA